MSAYLSDDPSAVYAVVDKSKKMKRTNKCSNDSENSAVYSLVDHSNTSDRQIKRQKDLETKFDECNKEADSNNMSQYSVLEYVANPPPTNNKEITIEKKAHIQQSRKTLGVLIQNLIVGALFLLVIALLIAVVVSYLEISRLKSKNVVNNEAITALQMSSSQFIKLLRNQLSKVSDNMTIAISQLLNYKNAIDALKFEMERTQNKSETYVKLFNFSIMNFSSKLSVSDEKIYSEINNIKNNIVFINSSVNLTNTSLQHRLNIQKSLLLAIAKSVQFVSSCKEIFNFYNNPPSGYYYLRLSNGSSVQVYCNMTMTCEGITGGWMRVAKLNKQSGNAECFQNLTNSSNRKYCIRDNSTGGCSSVYFPVLNVNYSYVCGTVHGYGVGTVDGFQYQRIGSSVNVDGISLTYGKNPRNVIWTFVAHSGNCNLGKSTRNYFSCMKYKGTNIISCRNRATCSPTFSRHLTRATSKDIELRVCRNEPRENEDVVLEDVEIYIN